MMNKKTTAEFLTWYFSGKDGYGNDITLKILDKLDAIDIKLRTTAPSLEDELQRDVTLRGIEAEREKYYAELGEHLVKTYRELKDAQS